MIYFTAHKAEDMTKLKDFIALAKNKLGNLIKAIKSDKAKECIGDSFEHYLAEIGIEHQLNGWIESLEWRIGMQKSYYG